MRLRACTAIAVFAMGCGGSTQKPSVSAPAPKAEPVSATAELTRSASDELRARWSFAPDAELVFYADLAGLAKTELVTGVVPPLLALAQGSLSDVRRECIQTLVAGAREIAGAANDNGGLAVFRFDDAAIKPSPTTCLQAAWDGQPTQMPGATAALELEKDNVAALQPGFVIFGTKAMVSEALKAGGAARFPTGLELPKDTHLRWRVRMPDQHVSASGSFASSHEFFRLDVKVDLESERAAGTLESRIAQGQDELKARVAANPKAKMALPVFDALHVTRDGSALGFVLDLREPPVQQARDVGILAGVAISGIRKYLLDAKLGEARATLHGIAKREVEAFRDLPPGKRKLASLPAVPKEVPHGMKYQSAASDWKPWSALKFSLGAPQYFQYEVVASKDGKHASIIARGDLNGDGKSSELTLKLDVNPTSKAIDVARQIEEKDAEE